MKKPTILLALCAAAILALSPAALAQQGTDLDCSQFGAPGASPEEAQAQAQATLDADPSDPNGLDPDGDGVACEFEASPTGEVSFEDGTGSVTDAAAPAPRNDLNCEDFASRAEAQTVLDADANDPNDLDADGDGIACNELFTEDPPLSAEEVPAQYQAPESPAVEVAPVAPPPGADSPVFRPAEPDVAEQAVEPAAEPISQAPRPSPNLTQLPETGGSGLPPWAALTAGGAISICLLMLAGGRRRA